MSDNPLNLQDNKPNIAFDADSVARLIARTQRASGEIPWSPEGKTDPWDHTEAAMGLTIGGYLEQARLAYRWLAQEQLDDGSWYASYRNGHPEDRTKEANMSAYLAVGLYHYFLITQDTAFLREMWDTVSVAIDFAVSLQAKGGEIHWAISPEGVVDRMALLTGSSSIYMSLKCALAIAEILGRLQPDWADARGKLEDALRNKPYLFNMAKSRFSMDWFYPVLCGATRGAEAQKRITNYWKKFVVSGQGVRCVSDEPWITVAETSELCLTLSAIGNYNLAQIVFGWISEKRFEDGSFWCGHTIPDMIVWPEEKITWTNGVALMAADALYGLTPAGSLFNHSFWHVPRESTRFAPAGRRGYPAS